MSDQPASPFVSRPAPPSQQPVVVVQQPGFWRSTLSWLGWAIAALFLMGLVTAYSAKQQYFDNSGGIQEKYHSLSKDEPVDKVAVLKITGTIMRGDGYVKQQIDAIREDESVRAVVVRVDSPGGTVYGSDYIYHHLGRLREERKLPMVVSMGSMAASGGYYVAMAVGDQEDCIYAEPLTTTGSIGVIIPHYDLSELLAKYGVKNNSIATHPRKQMLSMTRPLSDDDRQVIEKYINFAFDRFKTVIKSGRPQFAEHPEQLDELATGEVFNADQAVESGLVDRIGFIDDAIDRAIELADLDKSKTRAVTYEAPVSVMDALALGQASSPNLSQQLLQLSEPRAYYLATLTSLLQPQAATP